MKLWQKDFNVKQEVEQFTVGNDKEYDLLLAKYDVLGSIAHAIMLENIGILTKDELSKLKEELKSIYQTIKEGKFKIEEGVEDIHSQIELLLTKKLGETGKKIHSGRSRNDQVLLDLKLYLRDEVKNIVGHTQELFDLLIALSETHKDKLLPGYTHLQIAMPSSFGLWFGAYAESLTDDLQFLKAAYEIINKNPLGSAAGYGTSFPINRKMTTELLGFGDLNYNSVYAQMTRGKSEKALAIGIAAIAATLSKFSMDACLYMSQNFGFISFPDELTTGSSIMPHKKNPDVFELIRAKCNKLQSAPNELTLLTNNLPSGYHRDMQLTKEIIFPAIATIKSCMGMLTYMLKNICINENILNDKKYDYLFSVEEVNKLVLQGHSFRDAYKTVGENIQKGTYQPAKEVKHSHEGSINNLCNEQIKNNFYALLQQFKFPEIKLV